MIAQVFAIAGAVMRDAVRRKVVWSVVVFAALLSLVAPVLPSYGVGVVSAVYREIAVALMYAASFVVMLALAATRIPGETERRTVFNVLSRDVRRGAYVVGTWTGLFMVVGVAVAAFTLVAIVVGAAVYQELMWRLIEAAFAVWLEMGVIAAFTVLMSSLFGVVTNAVGALAFTFIGHSLTGLVAGPGEAPYVPSLDVFDVVSAVAHGAGYGLTYAAGMVGTFVAMTGLLLFAGSFAFRSRDL